MRILLPFAFVSLALLGTAEARLGETYQQSKARFPDLRYFPAAHSDAPDLSEHDLNFNDNLTGTARQFRFGPEGKLEVVLWFYKGEVVSVQYFCQPPLIKKFDGMVSGERPEFERMRFDQTAYDDLLKKNMGVSSADAIEPAQEVTKIFRREDFEFKEISFSDGSKAMFNDFLIILNSPKIEALFLEARQRKAKSTKQANDGL